MDSFGFGVLGGIFASSGGGEEEVDNRQKVLQRTESFADYTPPEITNFQQSTLQKKIKQDSGVAESIIPVKVSQILTNLSDGTQKFSLYNQAIGAICIVGQIQDLEKLTSAMYFQLTDETGSIAVNYADEAFAVQQGDYVQVVGSLVILAPDNFYVDAHNVMLIGEDLGKYKDLLMYHNVLVAYTAYHLDLGSKLKLQNKHTGKISELPGQSTGRLSIADIESVELGELYDHITEPVERLILQYLKARPDTLAKRSDIMACLSERYIG
ncbi:possible replication factor-a, putative [Babesia ovata]|uniref:Possible replication factor-a, putative n=1 Tax=Babesia ovata TaxID=189622 RepID=A0A2H6KHA0_9APIC|nr:possible replication factor-a, putative [Babesia ovata]GBE62349.1 possible replication factor-a, putative [Babesia ovata]